MFSAAIYYYIMRPVLLLLFSILAIHQQNASKNDLSLKSAHLNYISPYSYVNLAPKQEIRRKVPKYETALPDVPRLGSAHPTLFQQANNHSKGLKVHIIMDRSNQNVFPTTLSRTNRKLFSEYNINLAQLAMVFGFLLLVAMLIIKEKSLHSASKSLLMQRKVIAELEDTVQKLQKDWELEADKNKKLQSQNELLEKRVQELQEVADKASIVEVDSGMQSQDYPAYDPFIENPPALSLNLFERVSGLYEFYFSESHDLDFLEQKFTNVTRFDKFLGDYEIFGTIGQGSFGKVSLAKYVPTGEMVCIKEAPKVIYQDGEQRDNRGLLIKEAQFLCYLQRISTDHSVMLFEVISDPDNLYLVLEYCKGGSLAEYCLQGKFSSRREKEAWSFQMADLARGILVSLNFMHQLDIVHHDIKPENILVRLDEEKQQASLIFGDFGISEFWRPGNHIQRELFGTYQFLAPHFIQRPDEFSADIWALGATIYSMFSFNNALPYDCDPLPIISENFRVHFKGSFPPNIRRILNAMLLTNPTKRINEFRNISKTIAYYQ